MNKKYYYIANWKMYWDFDQTINFVTKHHDEFINLAQDRQTKIVLCPSIPTLYTLSQQFSQTNIALGGQDCSGLEPGAHTGQVSVEQLQSVGAEYCIIGHSEQRQYGNESNETVAVKYHRLISVGITPIICIGETLEQHKQGATLSILEAQLELIQFTHKPLFIAYEPVWAIGTGLIPTTQHLETVFSWLANFTTKKISSTSCSLLYGGSTSSKNIQELKTVDWIDGFLIGGASLNFDEFAKIIKSPTKG